MPDSSKFGPLTYDPRPNTTKFDGFKATPEPRWDTDYDKVLEIAKSTKRVVLAAFTGIPWCGPCVSLEKHVFKSNEFKNWWFGKVLLLSVNTPDDGSSLPWPAAKYGITAVPTVLGLDSDGDVLGQIGGSFGSKYAQNWIDAFESAMGMT